MARYVENTLFTNGNRKMYGSRFGWALVYEILPSDDGRVHLRVMKGRIVPEEVMYTIEVSKINLVVGCIYALMERTKKNVVLSIYGKEISFDCYSEKDRYIIAKKIRNFQKSLISIEETMDSGIKREISESIEKMLTTIDIY